MEELVVEHKSEWWWVYGVSGMDTCAETLLNNIYLFCLCAILYFHVDCIVY